MKTAVILPDIHYPVHSKKSIELILKLIKDIKPDEIIYQGDNLDMGVISHWNKDKRKTLELKRLIKDYEGFDKDILKPIEETAKKAKIVWLGGNHECLDDKTELLTKDRGWISSNEISYNDIVFSYNAKEEKGEWVKIDRIIKKNFNGELNRIKTNVIDLKATDEHKIFSVSSGKPVYTKISDIKKERKKIPVSASLKNKDYNLCDDKIKLTAWILTDGSVDKYGSAIIWQSKDCKKITDILDNLDYKYTISTRDRKIDEICGIKLKRILPQRSIRILRESRDNLNSYINSKEIPEWVEKLSDRQFKIFLSSLVDGDGSRHITCPETSWMLYGKKEFLEEIQKLCITHNITASLSVYRKGKDGEGFRLNIAMSRTIYNFEKNSTNMFKEEYNGVVWDLTVKNHNFMIRRNGKCHFTGNCWGDQYIEKNPELEGMIEPEICLKLKERKYKIIPYNNVYKLGKLNIIHGMFHNKYHSAKTLDVFEENVCYGHMHSPQMFTRTKLLDTNKFTAAYGLPCLSNLSPEYLKGRPNSWVNGFAVVYVLPNGNFNLYTVLIHNNQFIFNGKLYK